MYLSGVICSSVASIMDTKNTCCPKEVGLRAQKMNHSKFNIQYNWGDPHDHLVSMRIFILIIVKIFI